MKIHEQAFSSGLILSNDKDKIEPHWRPSTWPPRLGSFRHDHASVVVRHPDTKHDEMVVLLGGWTESTEALCATNSVIFLNIETNRWHEGRPMKEERQRLASVVCNRAIYAIGGENRSIANSFLLDTIEFIHVDDMLNSSSSPSNSTTGWTTLNCRLSTQREKCAAAVVYERFIVVVGGSNGYEDLASVDIIDTVSGNPQPVMSGPSLRKARQCLGMATIGNRLYVVGGRREHGRKHTRRDDGYLSSVEFLEFDDLLDNTAKSATSCFPYPDPNHGRGKRISS